MTHSPPGSNNHAIGEIETQFNGILRTVELAYGRHALGDDRQRAVILRAIHEVARLGLVRCDEFRRAGTLPGTPSAD